MAAKIKVLKTEADESSCLLFNSTMNPPGSLYSSFVMIIQNDHLSNTEEFLFKKQTAFSIV